MKRGLQPLKYSPTAHICAGTHGPFLVFISVRILFDHAEFTVQETNAILDLDKISICMVVTARHEGRFAAGDFKPCLVNVFLPGSSIVKLDFFTVPGPSLIAFSIECSRIAQVVIVQGVVHLVANPRRRKDFGSLLGAVPLGIKGLGDSRTHKHQAPASNVLEFYFAFRGNGVVFVRCPQDVLARGLVF